METMTSLEIQAIINVLEFYANPNHYQRVAGQNRGTTGGNSPHVSSIKRDHGKRARHLLYQLKQVKAATKNRESFPSIEELKP